MQSQILQLLLAHWVVIVSAAWIPMDNVLLFPYESDLLDHRKTVPLAQMPVNLHCEGAAILMAEPSAHSWNVYTGLNTGGGKKK